MTQFGFFQDMLSTLFRSPSFGRSMDDKRPLDELCNELMTSRGEVSGFQLAKAILEKADAQSDEELFEFFTHLAETYDIDNSDVKEAAIAYDDERSPENLARLLDVTEPARQELFRRLNQVPGATSRLVRLREKLLAMANGNSAFRRVDIDFRHLFSSWFNPGFLVLRRIDWQSPASILQKIIQYEAVHEIDDWDDLRRRLEPQDRRCYGFFHPSMPDDPLIFVEVALFKGPPGSVQNILASDRNVLDPEVADTAVFYSISNCQQGLAGISFGNFLIKQVVEDLRAELPHFKQFITLSPLPRFSIWARSMAEPNENARDVVAAIDEGTPPDKQMLEKLAAEYLLNAKNSQGNPFDPVARFHLNNGALVEAVHVDADVSEKGLRQSFGVMVNYLYDLKQIEKNHELFATKQEVAASKKMKNLVSQ